MAEVLKRLVGPKALANSNVTGALPAGFDLSAYTGSLLYTVPAVTTTVLRSIKVFNYGSSSNATLYFLYGTSTVDTYVNRMPFYQPPGGGTGNTATSQVNLNAMWEWAGTHVLAAGESLWGAVAWTAGPSTPVPHVIIHGVEIS